MRIGHPSSGTQLALTGVTKRYDDRIVLNEVSLTVKPGEKVGVIGDNGSGKSTLLRLLAGRSRPDNGSVTVAAPGGVGYLAQTLDLPDTALVGDAVDLALADLRDLERRMRQAELGLGDATPAELALYAELVARFEAREGYQADTRVEIMLNALDLPGLDRSRLLGTLSGGQRSRLALATTLAAAPEVLLLDEPTNDLDDQAVAWLENHLRHHRGTLIAVTHDRLFLERVTSTIVEVDHDLRTVRRYGNGYTGFLEAKAAATARWAREHQEWHAEVTRQEELADSHAQRLAVIPRKAPAAFSGAGAFRARSRTHGAMSRIRSTRARLKRLHLNRVPPAPSWNWRMCVSASTCTSSHCGSNREHACWSPDPTERARPRSCASWPANSPPTPAQYAGPPAWVICVNRTTSWTVQARSWRRLRQGDREVQPNKRRNCSRWDS